MSFLCLCVLLWTVIYADVVEEKLYSLLMTDYLKEVRPSKHYSKGSVVKFGFSLHQVIDVDERNQILTTSCWLNINWMDHRLAWNISEFDNISLIHFPHDKVWLPDIILTNNADPEFKEVMTSTDVFITNEGNVTWLIFAIFHSSCRMNVRYYPFDDQSCNLMFASWSHDGSELELKLTTEDSDFSNFMPNGEWTLLGMEQTRSFKLYSCCPDVEWPVITLTIHLGRRPLYYVFNQILPCVLISSMALLGFYIPADTGEKVTMCITTILSMGVFLKTINESMPPTSEAVPLIAMYYSAALCIVCAATLANVFTLKLYMKTSAGGGCPKPVPPWLRRVTLGCLAKLICMKIETPERLLVARSLSIDFLRRRSRVEQKRLSMVAANNYDREQLYECGTLLDSQAEIAQIHAAPLPQNSTLRAPNCAADSQSSTRKRKVAIKTNSPEFGRKPVLSDADESRPHCHCPLAHSGLLELKKEFESKFCQVLNRVYQTLEYNEQRLSAQDDLDRITQDWKLLAMTCDRFLLLLFVLATLITTVLILLEPSLEAWYASLEPRSDSNSA